ncbi:Bug family tripartite tricarboxylate transporter substrate binding protein [Bordetella tumulicola]|uniref:Bug family tripartite tricarboxylate transporter substrate binding protein n=1 Tax=Bordetella tumulicola TaxID=1649133 RepID=UPI0039EF5F81
MLSMAVTLFAATAWSAQPIQIEGPLRIVLPFGPGSGTDIYARLVAEKLGPALGTTVIVENKPGANGIISAESVARATPDGNTLLFTTNTTHAANPNMFKRLSYDPVKDFAPISKLGNLTFLLVVAADSPYQRLGDLIAAAHAKPERVSFGASNSFGTVSGYKLGKITDSQFLYIPYKSSPQIITDLLGGQVQFAFVDVAAATPMLKSGRMRALAVLADQRFPTLPSVPTMKDLGYPQFDVVAWFGMFAPAGTPGPVVDALNNKLVAVLQDPALRQRGAELGIEIFGSSPQELADYVASQIDLWKALTADAGLTKQ